MVLRYLVDHIHTCIPTPSYMTVSVSLMFNYVFLILYAKMAGAQYCIAWYIFLTLKASRTA